MCDLNPSELHALSWAMLAIVTGGSIAGHFLVAVWRAALDWLCPEVEQ